MSQAETTSYWNQIQTPGSPRLVQVLMQAGRLNQTQVDELRRRYQAQQRKPVTLPVGDATSSQEVSVEQAWNEALERDRILAEVLLNKRLVPLPQLQECRQIQRDQQLRLGVVIVKKGYASRSQIETAIGEVRRIGNRLPWPPQFFEPGGSPISSRHVPPPSGRHDPPLVAPPPREEYSDFGRPSSGHLPQMDPHGSRRLARDAAAASSRSGSGRQEWPMPGSGGGLAKTLEDDSGGGDPFASVRNTPGPGDPLFVPLGPEDVSSGSGMGMPPVVSPQEDGMPTVIHRAASPKGPLPSGLGGPGGSGSDFDDATVLGGHSLDELNPFANFPLQPPPGDSAAITLETPEVKGGRDPISGWGGGSDQQAAWPGSDMDILPSQSESGFGPGGGFAPLPGGSGSGGGFGEQEDPNESDGFKISAQGGGDLPLSESGPANPVPGFNPPSGGGVLPQDAGEHSHAPAALVAASASSRERAKARLDKNTKLLRALIGLCVGIFVISIALMAYILLFSDQPAQDPGPQDPGQQEAPETPEDPDPGQGGQPPPR